MQSLDTLAYQSREARVGTFRCAPNDARFEDSGPIGGFLFVFPRTAVTITHEGGRTMVADRNSVMLYNRGQRYRRGAVTAEGDVCDWFAASEEAVRHAVAPYDPEAAERTGRPFRFARGPASARLYLRQRHLVSSLEVDELEPLAVEQAMLSLLDEVVAQAYAARGVSAAPVPERTRRGHRELSEALKALLARDFARAPTLDDLAAELGVSPFHLSRVFRSLEGQTIHQHLDQLRLRAALHRLAEPRLALTQLALEVGYSSHSHFSAAFRRAFSHTPSAVRARLTGPQRLN